MIGYFVSCFVNSIGGSVTGNKLTINVNGINSQSISLPSGSGSGSGNWEELDISNLPTDFEVNDFILVVPKVDTNVTGTSWTGSISLGTVYERDNYNNIEIFCLSESGAYRGGVKMDAGSAFVKWCGVTRIFSPTVLNTATDSDRIMIISNGVFNGTASYYNSVNVTKGNISNYIKKIYRMKP